MSQRPPHARRSAEELSALLGPGTRYEGTLLFDGAVRIDGELHGRADGGEEGILIVGEGGRVEGEVEVGTLIVRGGLVDATVRAHRLVELHRGGTLRGELRAAELFVEAGAALESRCEVPGEHRHELGTPEEPATATADEDPGVAPAAQPDAGEDRADASGQATDEAQPDRETTARGQNA